MFRNSERERLLNELYRLYALQEEYDDLEHYDLQEGLQLAIESIREQLKELEELENEVIQSNGNDQEDGETW